MHASLSARTQDISNVKEAEKNRQFHGVPGPVYQPVKRHDETYPLTHSGPYPYADAPHSFGSKA
jgi:hypothetical protein